MGLSTVMQTALSGVSAASAQIEVIADNLANLQTPGFKAASVQYATLPPQTIAWSDSPAQIGSGVFVAGISRDSSPSPASGEVESSNVDPAAELIELTLTENMFWANLAVLHTADALLGELYFPWRR
jgi:flagellar hook protein FlgE